MHATVFMVAAGYTLLHNGHVRCDIFYADASPRGRALIDLIGVLIFLLPMCALIAWVAWPYVAAAWAVREGSQEGSLGIPGVYLLKSVILVFAGAAGAAGRVTGSPFGAAPRRYREGSPRSRRRGRAGAVSGLAEWLDLIMFLALCGLMLLGFPVAFTLAGTALIFAGIGWALGAFDPAFFGFFTNRIYGVMTNEVLIAVPLFVFMGVMLERSKVAEELLDTMGQLFGNLPGGLGISVTAVGALLAASTGIVGATVVTMGLLSLPTMLRRGYDAPLSCGSICAAGTLGQIIPPSIVLVVLADQISNAHQEAQRALGNWAPEPVSVGDLFAGALIPGLALVGLYILYQAIIALLRPESSPAVPRDAAYQDGMLRRLSHALIAPIVLIIAVLGSILVGVATPTEAAGVGAVGATLLAGARLTCGRPLPIYGAALGLVGLLVLTSFVDLRIMRAEIPPVDRLGIGVAALLCLLVAFGLLTALRHAHRDGLLVEVMRATTRITSMVFVIVIGAQLFSLVFRGFGGDKMVHELLTALPGGALGAMTVVMALIFIMGFFIEFIEITFVVVPVVGPVLLLLGLDPIWLGIMIAMNLQTSFLTPPFGLALFYLRGVAPPTVTTMHIYRGVVPFVVMQLFMLVTLALFPRHGHLAAPGNLRLRRGAGSALSAARRAAPSRP